MNGGHKTALDFYPWAYFQILNQFCSCVQISKVLCGEWNWVANYNLYNKTCDAIMDAHYSSSNESPSLEGFQQWEHDRLMKCHKDSNIQYKAEIIATYQPRIRSQDFMHF